MKINIHRTVIRAFDGGLDITMLDPREDPSRRQDVVDAGAVVRLPSTYLGVPACKDGTCIHGGKETNVHLTCVHSLPTGPKHS